MPEFGIPTLDGMPMSGRWCVCQKACTCVKVHASSSLYSMSCSQISRKMMPTATETKRPIAHRWRNNRDTAMVVVHQIGRKTPSVGMFCYLVQKPIQDQESGSDV